MTPIEKSQSGIAAPYRNRILASLPRAELARLLPHLAPLDLPQGETLVEPGQKVRHVWLMEHGLASIIVSLESGMSVEVGVVGCEGILGLPVLLGTESSPHKVFIQIPGRGYRVRSDIFADQYEKPGELRDRLQRCIQVHLVQAAQTAACNRLHDIAERLARWLLMCHDRIEGDNLQITHQALGDMLGAPRSTVTLAARTLQKAGLIEYTRGNTRILNRQALEDSTCECYSAIRREYRRLGVL